MSQYSPGFGQYPSQPYVEQRTSVMAVLSLVFSLICCPPGPSLLGAIFGALSLVAISRSNDRLVGRGLAIAGIIIGLIITSIWLGIFVGARNEWGSYRNGYAIPISTKLKAADGGDYAGMRSILSAEANTRITDADFDQFVQGYQSELGTVVGAPTEPVETFKLMMENAESAQQFQGRNDVLPVFVRFSNKSGMVLMQLDPATKRDAPPQDRRYVNVIVWSPSGTKWTLWDPQRLPPDGKLAPAPDTPPKPSDQPSEAPKPSGGGG
jgi:hypothetical protein